MGQVARSLPRVVDFATVLLVAALIVPQAAESQILQRIEIPSSFNPVGSGARALGMGGAFIAVADDATAASWNPGGLVQLERPEVSGVGSYFHRTEDLNFGTNPESDGKNSVSKLDLNFLSAVLPFNLLRRNMVVSINYQNLFDFKREWGLRLDQSSGNLAISQDIELNQDGNLYALGVAFGIQVVPSFSFGFTLNFWDDNWLEDNWHQTVTTSGTGTLAGTPFVFESKNQDEFSFEGFNMNLGLLWRATGRLTVGAVLKTPFTADVKRKSRFTSAIRFPSDPDNDEITSITSDENLDLRMPMSYGIGLSYRFSDAFTLSADVYRTQWDDFELKDSDGNKVSPISGKPTSQSDVDPTNQVRLGGEYLLIGSRAVIPLRLGAFYDPAPAEGNPDDYYGLSAGTGVSTRRFSFDLAYQYRFGHDVGKSILENLDFSEDVDEHTVYYSVIFYF